MTLLVGSIFHMTRKIVSEMTYNVSMGTLNPTILYFSKNVNFCNLILVQLIIGVKRYFDVQLDVLRYSDVHL